MKQIQRFDSFFADVRNKAGLKYNSQVARIFQASSGKIGKQQQEQYSPNLGTEI